MVDVDNFAALGIDAEDVDGFTELLRLLYDGLKNLNEEFERKCKNIMSRRKYLSVAFNIDNCKIRFCLWILVEISSKSLNSLKKMRTVSPKRAVIRYHIHPYSRQSPFP